MKRVGFVSSLSKGSLQVLCGLCLLAGSSALLYRLDYERHTIARAEQLGYLPKGDYLKLATLGYPHVVSDLIWLQAVQHIGAKLDTQLGYQWTYHAVDVLTDLDPTFVAPYQATGILLGVLVGRHEEGLAILRKGIRNNPKVWQLPFLAGYISYYELCNPVAGAEYFQIAAQISGAPSYLPRLAARMTVASGDPAAALEFLDRFSRTVTDARVREALMERMKEVAQEKDLHFLEESSRRYQAKYGRIPLKLDDLMLHGVIRNLPVDPFGGQYQLDPWTGDVSASSRRERLRIHGKVACHVSGEETRSETWFHPLPALQ